MGNSFAGGSQSATIPPWAMRYREPIHIFYNHWLGVAGLQRLAAMTARWRSKTLTRSCRA
tara:strand:- start:832 stop:1011 length:180 start_codon:yes stop_codon:yes gene_type:complete